MLLCFITLLTIIKKYLGKSCFLEISLLWRRISWWMLTLRRLWNNTLICLAQSSWINCPILSGFQGEISICCTKRSINWNNISSKRIKGSLISFFYALSSHTSVSSTSSCRRLMKILRYMIKLSSKEQLFRNAWLMLLKLSMKLSWPQKYLRCSSIIAMKMFSSFLESMLI